MRPGRTTRSTAAGPVRDAAAGPAGRREGAPASGRTAAPGTADARAARRPARKPRHAYHHGNLRQALVDQAVATIRERGVEALTLRDVGQHLRVSRTALYRHFADKQALVAAVAAEGFRVFHRALADAWDGGRRGRAAFIDMGRAYVRFARENPSHYRVMFGGFVTNLQCDAELGVTAGLAFGVLTEALGRLQQQGLVRAGDPESLAVFVWSASHGIASLLIDGQLARKDVDVAATVDRTLDRVWDGIAAG